MVIDQENRVKCFKCGNEKGFKMDITDVTVVIGAGRKIKALTKTITCFKCGFVKVMKDIPT
jgi:predicted nucleic-acid-binding Zn-ribbon protein